VARPSRAAHCKVNAPAGGRHTRARRSRTEAISAPAAISVRPNDGQRGVEAGSRFSSPMARAFIWRNVDVGGLSALGRGAQYHSTPNAVPVTGSEHQDLPRSDADGQRQFLRYVRTAWRSHQERRRHHHDGHRRCPRHAESRHRQRHVNLWGKAALPHRSQLTMGNGTLTMSQSPGLCRRQ